MTTTLKERASRVPRLLWREGLESQPAGGVQMHMQVWLMETGQPKPVTDRHFKLNLAISRRTLHKAAS
jgi:hypothetical protein